MSDCDWSAITRLRHRLWLERYVKLLKAPSVFLALRELMLLVQGPQFFGQIRTVDLRNSARFVQTRRFVFSHLTRSLTNVCV
jgi:hypothetical protein